MVYRTVNIFGWRRTTSKEYSFLEISTSLAPRTYTEECILFQIPLDESPKELYFKLGIIGPKQIKIKLS